MTGETDIRDILGERDDSVPERPTRVAQQSRESQLPKRFYSDVAVTEEQQGIFSIKLDGRPVRTPGRNTLASNSRELADALAQEWMAQSERIDPVTMPLTRLLNTAVDGVAIDPQAVKEDVVRYAGTDMLCYRADGPKGLVDRQTEKWDPLIDWAQSELGARFVLAEGVIHVEQPAETIAAFGSHIGLISDPVVLAALHVSTSLSGSAILAMALLKGEIERREAWQIAHLDEDWNIEQWGEDAEAMVRRKIRYREFKSASQVLQWLG